MNAKMNLIPGILAVVLGGVGYILPSGIVYEKTVDTEDYMVSFGLNSAAYEFGKGAGKADDSGTYSCDEAYLWYPTGVIAIANAIGGDTDGLAALAAFEKSDCADSAESRCKSGW